MIQNPRLRTFWIELLTFFINLVGWLVLTPLLARLAAQAGAGLRAAKVVMALFCFAVVFLQPLAAICKRFRLHQRNPGLGEAAAGVLDRIGRLPIFFYLVLQLMFLIYGSTLLAEAYGSSPGLFVELFFGLPILAALNTYFVVSYFIAPKGEPRLKFLQSPLLERIGEACVFVNTIVYQVLWWYLLSDPYFSGRSHTLGELGLRLLAVVLMAIFFYIPPRLFYYAENPDPKAAGLNLLWANLPIFLKVFLG